MDGNLAYREVQRLELISGKVMAMSPAATNHNCIAGNLFYLFKHYLRGKKCVPFGDGEKVFLTESDHYVPDFMIVCDRENIKADGVHGAPDLVVEILSPGTAANDRGRKMLVYEQCGVPEYWIVSPKEKSIEVYLLQDGRYTLDNLYTFYSPDELEYLTDKEKAERITEFKCHLYDDLTIRLEDIFSDLF